VFEHATSENPSKRKLFVVISSDKGLCGGIHSSVSKATRRAFADSSNTDADSPIMVVGDKSKSQLSRALPGNIALTFNQIGRDVPTFADAAGVADLILKSGVQYDSIALVYNRFVSALSYEPAIVEVRTENALKESCTFPAHRCSITFVLTRSYTSWLQGVRARGGDDQGFGRILAGQCHLFRSRRGPCLRDQRTVCLCHIFLIFPLLNLL
jgi:ATP synthase F1 gamma subunit